MSSIEPRRLLARLARPKEKAGVNCISKKFKSVACSSRRKTTRSSMPFLPEGIIFDILVLLPAEILHNVMRYVCREWYNVITSPEFINAHLQKSTNCLLIQTSDHLKVVNFVGIINNCDVRIRKLRYQFSNAICASCDGLVLFVHHSNYFIFSVANLITNQILTLPQLSEPIIHAFLSGLVHVHSIKRYKVVFLDNDSNGDLMCAIVTVGTDTAWRRIDTKHIPNTNIEFFDDPLSVGGYLYWTHDSEASSFLLALDVEAEIMHHLPLPEDFNVNGGYLMVRENFLALMVQTNNFLWEVRLLTELKKGEWTRLYNIDFTGEIGTIKGMLHTHKRPSRWHFLPLVWLKNGELVIFRASDPLRTYIVYNVKTGKVVSSFTIGEDDRYCMNYYRAHVNSLVSLNGC